MGATLNADKGLAGDHDERARRSDDPYDYFDVVPLHPWPAPLESFTGYLTRLAEANLLTSYQALTAVLRTPTARSVANALSDTSQLPWEHLSARVVVPPARLRATTFYHAAAKFGRRGALSTALFLTGSLTDRLRYCPACLAERAYYRLPWRFHTLEGCPVHRCHLLDRCGQCGRAMRFLAPPFKSAHCPACGTDLRTCRAPALAPAASARAQRRWDDLAFLLTPHPCEADPAAFYTAIGRGCARLRHAVDCGTAEAARRAAIPRAIVRAIERGDGLDASYPGRQLARYLAYADALDRSLRDLQEHGQQDADGPQGSVTAAGSADPAAGRPVEEELVARVRATIADFDARGRVVTQQAVAKAVGRLMPELRRYPRVMEAFAGIPLKADDDVLYRYAERAVPHLQVWGRRRRRVTAHGVAQRMHVGVGTLRACPRVVDLLERNGCPMAYDHAHEDAMLDRLRRTQRDLLARGQVPSVADLCRAAGVRRGALHYYPKLEALCAEVAAAYLRYAPQQHEDGVLQQVEAVITELRAGGAWPTSKMVAARLGVDVVSLVYYPRVRVLLAQNHQRRCRERRAMIARRDDELAQAFTLAAEQIRARGGRVTRRNVGKVARRKLSALNERYYPRTLEVLSRLVDSD